MLIIIMLIKLIQNIFTNLDEECILPKGSDSALIYKMNKNYSTRSIYSTSKISTHNKFTIEHFAGKIEYNIDNFIKKNMDKVNTDISKYIGHIFSDNIKKTGINRNKVKINSITNKYDLFLMYLIKLMNGRLPKKPYNC